MDRRAFLAVAASALAGCSAGASEGSETTARSPDTRLRIRSRTDREYEFSFELLELQTGTLVYEEARTLGPGDSVGLDSEFDPDTAYRFVVERAGRRLLNVSIYPDEGYVVTIRPGPDVWISEELTV